MDIWLDRTINDNKNVVDEDLRRVMHDSFDLIFDFLGKNNFKRWIDTRKLEPRIKDMIMEEFTKEDLEKYPMATGYYKNNTNRIRLKDKNNLDTNVHETYHFLVDNFRYEKFPIYLNEGMTEYLNVLTSSKENFSYSYNVRLVSLLHHAMGDSIIKAYLTSKIDSNKEFIENFTSYLTPDGKEDIKEYEKISKITSDIHRYKYGIVGKPLAPEVLQAERENYLKNEMDLKRYIQNIVVNYIDKNAKNLDYYVDGKLNFDKLKHDLENMTELAELSCVQRLSFSDTYFKNEIYKRAITKVVENSHIVAGEENKDKVVEEIVNQIFEEQEVKKNEKGYLQKYGEGFDKNKADELFNNEKNVALKLAELKLNNNEKILNGNKFNISEFITQVSNIREKTNISDIEFDSILNTYILKFCPEGTDIKTFENIVKENIDAISKISKIQKESNKNNMDTKFIKIDNGKFVEKKDNKLFYIETSKDGNIKEIPVTVDYDFGLGSTKKIEGYKNYDIRTNRKLLKVSLDMEMESTIIYKNGKRIDNAKCFKSYDDMKTEVILDSIHEKMKEKQYTEILNDAKNPYEIEGVYYTEDTDKRTRKINYDEYISDLKSILNLVPVDKQNEFVTNSLNNLLDKTYGTNNKDEKQIYSQIENHVKTLLNLKDKEKIDILMKGLDRKTTQLNDLRIDRIKDNKGVVHFKDEKAETKYLQKEKAEAKKKLREDERKTKDKERKFIEGSSKYVTEKESFDKDCNFPGVYVIGPFVATAKQSLDINSVMQDMKTFLRQYPQDKRDEKFNELSKKILFKNYGSGKSPINDEYTQKRTELYEKMLEMMKNEIFEIDKDTKFDYEEFNKMQSIIHDISKEEYESTKKVSVIGYVDKETEELHTEALNIKNNKDVPQDMKDSIIAALSKSNKSRLEAIELSKERVTMSEIEKQGNYLQENIRSAINKSKENDIRK